MNLYSRVPDKGKDPTAFIMDLSTTATAAASTTVYLVERMHGYSICGNIVDTTPAGKSFVAADVTTATDLITTVAHGFNTGLVVQVTNSGGGLPTGLTALTDYYIIKVSVDTYKFADSLAHALAGTAVDLTTAGTGTQTTTPKALAGTLKLQASNNAFTDNTDMNLNPNAVWTDIPSSTVTLSTGNTTAFWNSSQVYYEAVKVVWTSTSGSATLTPYFLAKGT